MFNSAAALLNSNPIGSALPRAPIRMSAACTAQAVATAVLAPIAKRLSAVISLGFSGVVGLHAARKLSVNCVGEAATLSALRCIRPNHLQASLMAVAATSARLRKMVKTSGTAVGELASSAMLKRKRRITGKCSGMAVITAVLSASNTDVAPEDRSMALPVRDNVIPLGEGTLSILKTINQQPADRLDYDVDCTPLVGDFDVVQSATATVAPSGLTVGAPTIFSDRVKLWISGGTDGTTYKVTVTVTSRDGRIQQNEIRVKIKEV